MKIKLDHHLLCLFLLSTFYELTHSANTTNSTYYYNQCAPSTCGNSILKFPFGKNTLCSSAYVSTQCENGKVYLTDEENKYIKYKLLQNLTKDVYSDRSVKLVDSSLFGCGMIPNFKDYRTGTFFNCTKEPDKDTLAKLRKAPCLECGESSNLCYFYDGYIDHVDTCRSFRVAIPVQQFGNLSNVENLRKVLQEGFEVEWDGDCDSCVANDVGRCGYKDQERKSGEEYCFCANGVHKSNCTDGVIVPFDAVTNNTRNKSKKSPIGMIVGIVTGAVVFLLASCIVYKRKHKKKHIIRFRGKDEQILKQYLDGENNGKTSASIETFLKNYTLGRPTRFSYKQLKKYTKCFNQKIGQGGFGSVFKGYLPNGFIIAVKILDESTNQIQTQFLNEVLTIGRIHHNHLVRLLGYCFDQCRVALVYEYMVNGSLEKYIHQKKDAKPTVESVSLTWAQLHNIAIGTAKGLAYLHEECRSRILHCDIKPHNILLDENFQPKVSDFGLAMALNKENSHISVTHGTGTPGYAPPEMWYVKFGPVTDKSDVYSFGMVVLEMAGKRRNFEVDVSKSSELYFPQWVFSHHVQNAYGDGRGSRWHECACKIEEGIAMKMELVGLWCIQFEPAKRPSMRKVVDMLEGNVAIETPPAPFDPNMTPFGCGDDIKIMSDLNLGFGTSDNSAHDSTTTNETLSSSAQCSAK
ncbi:hypothetical protein ACHQM5_026931 [Ranunculus cassubicifolius]